MLLYPELISCTISFKLTAIEVGYFHDINQFPNLRGLLVSEFSESAVYIFDYSTRKDEFGDILHLLWEIPHLERTFICIRSVLADQIPLAKLEDTQFNLRLQ